ncbi:hypothetical protein GTW31_13575 [Vibrio parahaemolyticus]|nr:hypothetical protein [Vibrio parahaemolyticus]
MIEKIEHLVYSAVKNNAKLKKMILLPYQFIFSFIGRCKPRLISKFSYTIYENCFFGFHDRSSLNSNGYLLSHREISKFKNGMGSATIGYFRINDETKKFNEITITSCCNYQQGSMLTWFGEDSVIFNDSINERAVTKVVDLKGDVVLELPFHYFSISASKKYLTAIDFNQFGDGMLGYGYASSFNYHEFNNESCFLIYNIVDASVVFRLTLKEIESRLGWAYEGNRYFSHSSFNIDDRYCYFLYRGNDGKKNSSILLVYDFSLNDFMVLPTSNMVSHLCWLNSNVILAYCSVDNNDGYYKFSLHDGLNFSVEKLKCSQLTRDGHPTSTIDLNDENFITDCYPDKMRRQKLYTVNEGDVDIIFDVYSKFKYRGFDRVDFHPRFSNCGRYITVDSPHLNNRCQIIIDVKKKSNENAI